MNDAKTVISLITNCLILGIISVSCTGSYPVQSTDKPDTAPVRSRESIPPDESVTLHNPNYEVAICQKAGLFEELLMYAENEGRLLLGGGLPLTYDALLNEGSLIVIPANRYTGSDMANIKNYSLGDFWYDFDANENVRCFFMHNGDKDIAYDPDAVEAGKTKYYAGQSDVKTDGKTIMQETYMEAQWFAETDPSTYRQSLPVDDEACARMYLLYHGVNKIMLSAGWTLDSPFQTLDEYISFIGRKNPVAWTNPYTGDPTAQREWYLPSLVVNVLGPAEPSQSDATGYPENGPVDVSTLPGNYAYTVVDTPSGAKQAHVLFFFKTPDGGVGAFRAVGLTSDVLEKNFEFLEKMAEAGGYVNE